MLLAAVSGFLVIGVGAVAMGQIHQMKMKDMRPASVKHAAYVIVAGRKEADKKGNYDCCLKHDCDYCELHKGYCHCEEDIQNNKPVCIECKGGWMAGDGGMKGINPKSVKVVHGQ